ncbi:AGAP011604-PA-like protein [Anopheles sinensis]|uniref:AGAP011604-PA-like protein n=1 Tax=Anopheles sinensis TaxID=74873 RepID=A0A084WGQ5_ANOSI|nr:AGAP011604-PA-like protein [Anopheles sinensis]
MPANCLVKYAVVIGVLSSVTLVLARPGYNDAVVFPKDDGPSHSMPVFLPTGGPSKPKIPGVPMESSAASNTGSQTLVGPDGSIQQQTAGGSQSANLAADGSKGQLSATNTQQQSFQSGDKFQSQNQAQGQSASFDKNHQALSNANTNTNVVRDGQNVREQTSGGAASSLQTAQGSQASQAQTNSESFKEGGKQGDRSTGSAQSQHIGMDGSLSASNANTGSERVVLADGTVVTKSTSSSSSQQVVGNTKVFSQSFSSTFGG